MPPKRGRGRGGTGAAATLAPAFGEPESRLGDDAPSGFTNSGVPTSTLAGNVLSFTGDPEPSEMVITSPNASPASAPTETPAPTPVRAPVQRLESLANRSGLSSSRATSSVSKFKPRGGRRDKDERDKAEREEVARLDARAAEERVTLMAEEDVGRATRGIIAARGDRERRRGGRGGTRGRADTRGRGGMDTGLSRMASGPFAIAPQAVEKKKPGLLAASSATGRERVLGSMGDTEAVARKKSKTTMSTSATAATGSTIPTAAIKLEAEFIQKPTQTTAALEDINLHPLSIKLESHEPLYPEDHEEGRVWAERVDIERINLVSDDEKEAEVTRDLSRRNGDGRTLPSTTGLRPVRLQRDEHKNRATIVNTDSAAAPSLNPDADDEGMFVEQDEVAEGRRRQRIEFLRDGKRWPGVWRDEDGEPQIKADPGAASNEAMNVDTGGEAHTPAVDSVKMARMEDIVDTANRSDSSKTAEDVEVDVVMQSGENDDDEEDENIRSSAAKKIARARTRQFSPRDDVDGLHLQTEEDRAEFLRGRKDLRCMVKELGSVNLDTESDLDETGVDTEMDDDLHHLKVVERISLFQFPPGLPSLRNAIKKEEEESDFEMLEVATRPSRPDQPVDLTADETVVIKTEAGKPGMLKVPESLIGEDGFVGRLIVRKTGKVELNWGGTGLILGRGTESDFLSLMVALSPEDDSMYESHNRRDFSATAGSTSSKLIATPAWDELLVETISLAEDSDEFYEED